MTRAISREFSALNIPYLNKSEVEAARIPASIDSIILHGFDVAGDGKGGIYKRSSSQPVAGTYVQSGDDAFWLKIRADNTYFPSDFGSAGEGVSDSTAAWLAMAAAIPAGARVIVSGTHILSSLVTFSQSNLEFVFIGDSWIKQKDGTQTLDNLVLFSGANGRLINPGINGNAFGTIADMQGAGNGNPSYTGRGEVVIISGDNWYIQNARLTGSRPGIPSGTGLAANDNLASVITLRGNNIWVNGFYSFNTGYTVIRVRGKDIKINDFKAIEWQCKAIADDGDSALRPNATTMVENGYLTTTVTTQLEGVMADPQAIGKLGKFVMRNIYINAPNAVAVDICKFAYVSEVIMENVVLTHGSGTAISFRLQESVNKLTLRDCVFDGSIAFSSGTVDCICAIEGSTELGKVYESTNLILNFRGALKIADGVKLSNYTQFAVLPATAAQYPAWTANTAYALYDKVKNGSNIYMVTTAGTSAASGGPTGRSFGITDNTVTWKYIDALENIQVDVGSVILNPPLNNSTAKFVSTAISSSPALVVGSLKARAPMYANSGANTTAASSWMTNQDSHETIVQVGSDSHVRVFAGTSTHVPSTGPVMHDGWRRGDIIHVTNPSSGGAHAYKVTTSGSGCGNVWAISTAYTVGNRVYNGSSVFECITAGTSAGSGGPTGTSSSITDNTAVWKYVAPLAVFKSLGNLA
jgi:hypothetical protein